jgi:hypothetical protein
MRSRELVQREYVDAMRILGGGLVDDECDALDRTSALLGETRSRVIHENPPHQTRRNSEEMGSVAPLKMPLIDEADVHFVHEGGWLQRMASCFTTHLCRRDAPEVVIDERDQLVERSTPPFAHRKEQFRNPGRVFRAVSHQVRPQDRPPSEAPQEARIRAPVRMSG